MTDGRFTMPAEWTTQPRAWLPGWDDWLVGLPRLVGEVFEDWDLTPEGSTWNGFCSVVLPVTAPDGEPAALKVGFPDEESEFEHLALQHWGGDGAVRLLRADPRRRAMLLERLDRLDLTEAWDVEACEVIGDLYARLHRPAPPQLRGLGSVVRRWAGKLDALPRDSRVPHRLVQQAVSLARELAEDPRTEGRLVHTDLHYQNVLAGQREPWLVIDPKPLSGDPHVEVAPLLWNRWEEMAGDVRGGIRRRFEAVVDAAMLDEDRARAWVTVRMMLEAADEVATPAPDEDWLTRCVSIVKAVQP